MCCVCGPPFWLLLMHRSYLQWHWAYRIICPELWGIRNGNSFMPSCWRMNGLCEGSLAFAFSVALICHMFQPSFSLDHFSSKFMFDSQHEALFYSCVPGPSRCQQGEMLHYWISLSLECPYAGTGLWINIHRYSQIPFIFSHYGQLLIMHLLHLVLFLSVCFSSFFRCPYPTPVLPVWELCWSICTVACSHLALSWSPLTS